MLFIIMNVIMLMAGFCILGYLGSRANRVNKKSMIHRTLLNEV